MSETTIQPDDAQAIRDLFYTVLSSIWRMDSAIRGRKEVDFEENDSIFEIIDEAGEEAANIGQQAMSDLEKLLSETLGFKINNATGARNSFEQYREQYRACHYKQAG